MVLNWTCINEGGSAAYMHFIYNNKNNNSVSLKKYLIHADIKINVFSEKNIYACSFKQYTISAI